MDTRLKKVLIIVNIVFISMLGLIRTADKSDSLVFSIVPAFVCIIVLLFGTKKYILFEEKSNIIWDFFFSGLFILMLSLEDVLKTMRSMGAEPFNMVFKIIYFPILLIALVIDIDYALLMAMRRERLIINDTDNEESSQNGKFLGIYYPVWALVSLTFVFLIAYYPGLTNSDFDKQWIWGRATNWSDWHTVGFLFFVKLCTVFTKKVFMITIAQALMYYLTANYTVGVLNRRFASRGRILGWIFIFLYVCFGFYSCMYISQIQKNNCSTPMMLAFSVSLLDYALSTEHTKREYINIGAFAFLASIFRHSLFEVVLITLIFFIAVEFFNKNEDIKARKKNSLNLAVIVVTTFVMFYVLTEVIAFGILKAERNPGYIKYTIPMNLAASMAYRSRETGLKIDESVVEKMEQIIPMEKWAEYYCPFDADTTCRTWHEIGDNVLKLNDPKIGFDILEVNLYYLTHYPKQFIISFFDVNSIVWEITVASDLVMYSPGTAYDNYDLHHMRKGEFFFFSESIKQFLASFAIGRAVVYRGGLYMFLMAVIIIVLFKKRQFQVFTAMMPVLLYAMALMISIPQEGSQYIQVFPLYVALFGIVAYIL